MTEAKPKTEESFFSERPFHSESTVQAITKSLSEFNTPEDMVKHVVNEYEKDARITTYVGALATNELRSIEIQARELRKKRPLLSPIFPNNSE